MDTLPVEILGEIASVSEETYRAIALVSRLFALGLSPGVIVDWQIHFGHSCAITNIRISWRRWNLLHRVDGPADVWSTPSTSCVLITQRWYRNGNLHRIDGPAETLSNGTQCWFRNGVYHRDDGPASIYPDGTQHWCLYGKLHRDGGPALIFPNGRQAWYRNGVLYRDDGIDERS